MSQPVFVSSSILEHSSKQKKADYPPVTYLTDLSARDRPWDSHKNVSKMVQLYYKEAEFTRYAERVEYCSDRLGFSQVLLDDNTFALTLRDARFCRLRFCPICQWRRSLMWKAKAIKILPLIKQNYPDYKWIFLTLTVTACEITDLKETLKLMGKGYQRLIQRKLWPGEGWIRSTEVTRTKSGMAHPHYHCLILVKPAYFTKGYINQNTWAETWGDAMRIDYKPIVHVTRVGTRKPIETAIPEMLKYTTKESQLIENREFFIELTRQMNRVRCVASGGILKEYFKDIENDETDLIGEGDENSSDEDYEMLVFNWSNKSKKYGLLPN
jgi:plasmid rolling circle replication initiator protein Rep